jgi:serine/threonine protein kinase
VDKRADIWAFGCVLYEMLADAARFSGATSTELFAAILEREPDWRMLRSLVPPSVARLVRRLSREGPEATFARYRGRSIGLSEQANGDARFDSRGGAATILVASGPPRSNRSGDFNRRYVESLRLTLNRDLVERSLI